MVAPDERETNVATLFERAHDAGVTPSLSAADTRFGNTHITSAGIKAMYREILIPFTPYLTDCLLAVISILTYRRTAELRTLAN